MQVDKFDAQLERQVIASCMRMPSRIPLVLNYITEEHFTDPILGIAFSTIAERYKSGESLDPTIIKKSVNRIIKKEKEVEETIELARWEDLDEVNIESTCKMLNNCKQARDLERLAESIKNKVYRGEVSDTIISDISSGLKNISESSVTVDELWTLGQVIDNNPLRHKAIYDATSGNKGVCSPWPHLDALTGGFRPGRMYIFAARPGVGKTALSAQIAYHAAIRGKKVVFFSHETKREDMWRRIASCETKTPGWDMELGQLTASEKQKVTEWIDEHRDVPLYITDKSGRTIQSMNAELRRFESKNGKPDLVIVDYLQLVRSGARSRQSRYEEVSEVTHAMNQCKVDFNTAMIVLSQLNRSLEMRDDPRPQLSDLRESGEIEQDADAVVFSHRPGFIKGRGKKKDKGPTIDPSYTELLLEKMRQGRTGYVKLEFVGEYSRFNEWEEGRPIEV